MAKRQPKIVVLKEDQLGVQGVTESVMSAAAVKRDTPIDAVATMQTEFEPAPDSVLENTEFGFSAMELTDAEAEKIKKSPEVEDVVDDEMQYAFAPYDPPGAMVMEDQGDLAQEDYDEALLELDEDEMQALEEEIDDEINPMFLTEEQAPSAAELDLLTQREPSLTEAEIAIEHTLLDAGAEATGEALAPAKGELGNLAPAIRQVFSYLTEQKRPLTEVSDEELETVLRTSRLREALAEPLALRDIILPNIRQIYANYAWRYARGAGVRLAIVDTGIAPHVDLRIYGGVSFVPGVRSWRDDHGHGTHVAGTAAAALNNRGIAGVAPLARLYAVKVLNRQGSGRLSWILNGLTWCYLRRMHVVNLSLGSRWPRHNPNEFNTAYEAAGRRLRRRGILPIAAAGNSSGPVGNPARCPSFMAVSAIDGRRRRAGFSNFGPQTEVCAPGVQILSTVPGGYGRKSGTSMSSPHVAGTAALVKSRRPTWHGDVIRRHMMRTALDLGRPGRDWVFGYGQVNAYRAVR